MMRISDLLGSEVLQADGTRLGRVREVRIVQDGPIVNDLQAAFRVDAVIVGRGSLGVRLGYHAEHVRGPWLLNVLFRRTKLGLHLTGEQAERLATYMGG